MEFEKQRELEQIHKEIVRIENIEEQLHQPEFIRPKDRWNKTVNDKWTTVNTIATQVYFETDRDVKTGIVTNVALHP